jgi:hypothetical protein
MMLLAGGVAAAIGVLLAPWGVALLFERALSKKWRWRIAMV